MLVLLAYIQNESVNVSAGADYVYNYYSILYKLNFCNGIR